MVLEKWSYGGKVVDTDNAAVSAPNVYEYFNRFRVRILHGRRDGLLFNYIIINIHVYHAKYNLPLLNTMSQLTW